MGANLPIMQKMLGNWETGDKAALCRELVAVDCEIHEPPALPQGGIYKGWDAPLRVSAIYRDLWHVEGVDHAIWEVEREDIIVGRYVLKWTARSTGRSLTQPILEANWFRAGKISRMEVFHFDPQGLIATLG